VKRKAYYFICRRCNRRKLVEEESPVKYGVCLKCYNRDADTDEREAA
jgi:ribosomal protein L40E